MLASSDVGTPGARKTIPHYRLADVEANAHGRTSQPTVASVEEVNKGFSMEEWFPAGATVVVAFGEARPGSPEDDNLGLRVSGAYPPKYRSGYVGTVTEGPPRGSHGNLPQSLNVRFHVERHLEDTKPDTLTETVRRSHLRLVQEEVAEERKVNPPSHPWFKNVVDAQTTAPRSYVLSNSAPFAREEEKKYCGYICEVH